MRGGRFTKVCSEAAICLNIEKVVPHCRCRGGEVSGLCGSGGGAMTFGISPHRLGRILPGGVEIVETHFQYAATNFFLYSPITGSWDTPEWSGILCQSSSSSGGAWLEPRRTANPALTSALCSVTRITPCGLGLGNAVWSTWSEFKLPAQLGTGPGSPQCCRRCASCHKSSTSNSGTGTQSLSRSTMLRPGKTRQRAARTKVPAHVWWTKWRPLAWLTGKKTTSQSSWAGPWMQARLAHQAATAGQCCSEGSGLSRLVRSLLSTRTYTVERNRRWLILARIKPNKRLQSGLPISSVVSRDFAAAARKWTLGSPMRKSTPLSNSPRFSWSFGRICTLSLYAKSACVWSGFLFELAWTVSGAPGSNSPMFESSEQSASSNATSWSPMSPSKWKTDPTICLRKWADPTVRRCTRHEPKRIDHTSRKKTFTYFNDHSLMTT